MIKSTKYKLNTNIFLLSCPKNFNFSIIYLNKINRKQPIFKPPTLDYGKPFLEYTHIIYSNILKMIFYFSGFSQNLYLYIFIYEKLYIYINIFL